MHSTRRFLAVLVTGMLCTCSALAQSEFLVTFRGTCYQTNTTGSIAPSPVTDQTILQELAAPVGLDPSTITLVYHIAGSSFGDTIDVVNKSSGATLDTEWGFFFGSDLSLGRMALTNAPNTEVRRVDQLYTKQSPYALGSAFITKRFQPDSKGNVRNTVDAEMHYLVLPTGSTPTKFIIGSFTTTKPFIPGP